MNEIKNQVSIIRFWKSIFMKTHMSGCRKFGVDIVIIEFNTVISGFGFFIFMTEMRAVAASRFGSLAGI